MSAAAADEIRQALLGTVSGTLGTISVDPSCAGYPFLSVVPFALDAHGQPIVQLAEIAQHTKNARADSRVSLLVRQPDMEGDPQSGWRVTLLGRLGPVAPQETEELMARLVERVPKAREYEATHAFALYRLDVQRIRFIGGFGKIHWLEGAAARRDPAGAGLSEAAPGAIAHMNRDHADSMVEMCRGLCGFHPARAEMIALDRAGMMVRSHAPDRLCYFSFGREIDAASLRPAVIGVLTRAREAAKRATAH